MESRPIYWGLHTPQVIMFYVIGTASMLIFLYGFYRHIAKYAHGRSLTTPVTLGRVLQGVKDIFSHRTLRRRDKGAGFAHTGVFSGYLGGFIATSI